jgi:hypothetical protein
MFEIIAGTFLLSNSKREKERRKGRLEDSTYACIGVGLSTGALFPIVDSSGMVAGTFFT